MTIAFNCPFCAHDEVEQVEVPRLIHDVRSHAEYSMQAVEMECRDCHEHFVTPEQSDENDLRLADAKGHAIGAPSREAIKQLRDSWNMTQEIAGTLFGGGKVAFCKYESGTIVPTQAMARLLALAVAGRIDKVDLEQAAAGTLQKREVATSWSYASRPSVVHFNQPKERPHEKLKKTASNIVNYGDSPLTDFNQFSDEIYDKVWYQIADVAPHARQR